MVPTLIEQISRAQYEDAELRPLIELFVSGTAHESLVDYSYSVDGCLRHFDLIEVPSIPALRQSIMDEAHHSRFSIHPGGTKMYQDLRRVYRWEGMKRDVAEYVSRCHTCQLVKAEHRKPPGRLSPLEVPQWK